MGLVDRRAPLMADAVTGGAKGDEIGLVVRPTGLVPILGRDDVMHVELLADAILAAVAARPSVALADLPGQRRPTSAPVALTAALPVPMRTPAGSCEAGRLGGARPGAEPRRRLLGAEGCPACAAGDARTSAVGAQGVPVPLRRGGGPAARTCPVHHGAWAYGVYVGVPTTNRTGGLRGVRGTEVLRADPARPIGVDAMRWHSPQYTPTTIP